MDNITWVKVSSDIIHYIFQTKNIGFVPFPTCNYKSHTYHIVKKIKFCIYLDLRITKLVKK